MKVCFEDGGTCYFTMAVFQDTILPKQFCMTGSSFLNSGLYISRGMGFFSYLTDYRYCTLIIVF